jgi:hypothetical protein
MKNPNNSSNQNAKPSYDVWKGSYRIAISLAAAAIGLSCIATDASARGGGFGGGHMGGGGFGGGIGGGHMGGPMGGMHFGGPGIGGRSFAAPWHSFGASQFRGFSARPRSAEHGFSHGESRQTAKPGPYLRHFGNSQQAAHTRSTALQHSGNNHQTAHTRSTALQHSGNNHQTAHIPLQSETHSHSAFNQSTKTVTMHKDSLFVRTYNGVSLTHKIVGNRHTELVGHSFKAPPHDLSSRLSKLKEHQWHTNWKRVVISPSKYLRRRPGPGERYRYAVPGGAPSGGALPQYGHADKFAPGGAAPGGAPPGRAITPSSSTSGWAACEESCKFDVPTNVYGEFVSALDEAKKDGNVRAAVHIETKTFNHVPRTTAPNLSPKAPLHGWYKAVAILEYAAAEDSKSLDAVVDKPDEQVDVLLDEGDQTKALTNVNLEEGDQSEAPAKKN